MSFRTVGIQQERFIIAQVFLSKNFAYQLKFKNLKPLNMKLNFTVK